MKLLILIVSLAFIMTQLSTSHSTKININEEENIHVRDTFHLFAEGKRNIILSEQRNLVLVLGNTGSGKSTFLQWLFGDNKKLLAKRTTEGTYIIEDGNKRIGYSTINSKTLFPELVIGGNSAYYDCPGFSDTRNTSYEIAITYFIKRVTDHAKKVKLVFTVNHSSMRKGVDRVDFMKLLTHATELIKDIKKFRNSIAIIVTKVDNLYKYYEDGVSILITDDDIINGIAEFLIEVKGGLAKDSSKVKYVQLINIFLLKTNSGRYSRIGIFRRPSRAGPLNKIPMLQKGKNNVIRILNGIVFSSKTVKDFGYTVSDRTKADIIYLVREIEVVVEDKLAKIGDKLLNHYRVFVLNAETKLSSFISEDVIDVNAIEEIERANSFLILGIREISRMVGKIRTLKNPRELVEIIRSGLHNIKLDLPINEILDRISKQSEYFHFLQQVSKVSFLIPKSWTFYWEKKGKNLSILSTEFLNYTKLLVENVTTQVDSLFSSFGRLIYDHHKETVERMKELVNNSVENINVLGISKMKENLNDAVNVAYILTKDIQKINNLSILYEKVIESVENIPHNNKLDRKLKKFLFFLNNQDINVKMRNFWSVLFKNEASKISNFNREFQIFTNSMMDIENVRITYIIANSKQILQDYYKKLSQKINYEINSFVNGSLPSSDPFLVQKLVKQLSKGYFMISKLSTESVHITNPIELADKMLSFASNLNIDSLSQVIAKVETYLSSLNFLLKVNNEVFAMPIQWVKMFQTEAKILTELRDNCKRITSGLMVKIRNTIRHLLGNVGQSMKEHYAKAIIDMELKIGLLIKGSDVGAKVDPIQAQAFRENINLGINIVLDLTNYFKKLTNVTMLTDKISQSAKKMKLEVSADLFKNIEKNCDRLNYLLIASNQSVIVERSWVNQFQSTGQYVLGLRKEFESRTNVLILEIKSRIEDLITNFCHSLNKHYEIKLNEVKIELGFFTTSKIGFYSEVDVGKAKEMALDLNNGLAIMANMSASIQNLSSPSELKSIISNSINIINGFHISQKFIKNVSFQVEVLNFVSIAKGDRFKTPKQWSSLVKNMGQSFRNALIFFKTSDLSRACESVYSLIKSDLEAVDLKIIYHFEETDNFLENLENTENAILKLSAENKKESDLLSYLKNIVDCVVKLNIDKKVINIALKRYSQLEYMQAFSENEIISVKPFSNFELFGPVLKFLKESPIWHGFLLELDNQLSRYEIQSDASRYNVADLDDWGKVNKPQGISIRKNNFHQFLEKLNIKGEIRNLELTESRLKALENIFDINLRGNYDQICDENGKKIIFRGNFIKFSDFIDGRGVFQNPCLFSPTNINFFASKSVFIDRDLIAIGSQFKISIKALRWEVIGGRWINLDGADAQSHHSDRASGDPKLPSGLAGSLMGIGETFVNGAQLRISANDGRDDRGQHSEHGWAEHKDENAGKVEIIELGKYNSEIYKVIS